MDAEPQVQIVQKSFFHTKKGLATITTAIAILIFLILLIGLNYFNFISPTQLSFLPKKSPISLTSSPLRLTITPQNYGFKAGELTLGCPVESSFCQSESLINISKADAISYKAASQSSVLNLVKVARLENMAVLENKQTGKKYFYESVVSKNNDSCYTIAYTLPSDATFKDLINLSFLNVNTAIATLGTKTFAVEGKDTNVIIQVRNSPIDPGVPCSLIRKSPDFFKTF